MDNARRTHETVRCGHNNNNTATTATTILIIINHYAATTEQTSSFPPTTLGMYKTQCVPMVIQPSETHTQTITQKHGFDVQPRLHLVPSSNRICSVMILCTSRHPSLLEQQPSLFILPKNTVGTLFTPFTSIQNISVHDYTCRTPNHQYTDVDHSTVLYLTYLQPPSLAYTHIHTYTFTS